MLTNISVAVAMNTAGKLEAEAQAAVLFQRRNWLYWWLVRMIPDFPNIFLHWDAQTSSHIHSRAIDLGLSTSHCKNHDLGDTELKLMFQRLSGMDIGAENWRQQYIAWLIVHLCPVRPSSFAVCPGFEQGMRTISGE